MKWKESMWTIESLSNLVKQKLSNYLFIVVSNREPYIHTLSENKIKVQVPPSGLTIALDPIMQACRGTWIAHGNGNADKEVVDQHDRVRVPTNRPRYSLRRVWLSREDIDGYYYGFSNEGIWPLCHVAYTRPIFNESDWITYKKVNEIFAKTILEEIGDKKAFVFIQDYHLALVSKMIKEKNHSIITAQFWHIPWPNPEVFRICPWQKELLTGLLSNDLLGFQIHYHCINFVDTVDRSIEARIDREKFEVTCDGKKSLIRHFPISIDFERISLEAQKKNVTAEMQRIKDRLDLQDELIIIGMDRIDYTKGIPDRFRAIDRLLEKYPEYQKRFVFIQAGVISRIQIGAYRKLREEIENLAEEINWRNSAGHWKPIHLLLEHESQLTLMALRRMASICVVSSLHDGMNLVAKEFVASRFDEDGILILSQFAGASRELVDALMINPYATDHLVETIKYALDMPREERQRRMKKMRETVRENNIYKWGADIISELTRLEHGE